MDSTREVTKKASSLVNILLQLVPAAMSAIFNSYAVIS